MVKSKEDNEKMEKKKMEKILTNLDKMDIMTKLIETSLERHYRLNKLLQAKSSQLRLRSPKLRGPHIYDKKKCKGCYNELKCIVGKCYISPCLYKRK